MYSPQLFTTDSSNNLESHVKGEIKFSVMKFFPSKTFFKKSSSSLSKKNPQEIWKNNKVEGLFHILKRRGIIVILLSLIKGSSGKYFQKYNHVSHLGLYAGVQGSFC